MSGKKIIKLKIVHILCELFLCNDDAFYKLVHIHNFDYDIFVCLVTLDKTVMTSLAVKKVKFKYSLIEICIYDYKCIMINWVKFITRLITFLY